MMSPEAAPATIADDERLARFILFQKHVRADRTVRPDAFIPHPHTELSVTRHLAATVEELWQVGHAVAGNRERTLYGRADVRAVDAFRQRLTVVAAPLPENPNHANVGSWPTDKAAQKLIAQQLAAVADYFPA